MKNSEEFKLIVKNQLNNTCIDVLGKTFDEVITGRKNGTHTQERCIVWFCLAKVCDLGRADTNKILNIPPAKYDAWRKKFDKSYGTDDEFVFTSNLFVKHFKKLFNMWYEKMSKEDKERAKASGLIKEEEPKGKVEKWNLVFVYCGSQEIICGPSRYNHCMFMKNKKKRETQYQRGEFKIIPA